MTSQNRRSSPQKSKHVKQHGGDTDVDGVVSDPEPSLNPRANVDGSERHDANAHRNTSNAANQFGEDGEGRYGGGARPGTHTKTSSGKGKT